MKTNKKTKKKRGIKFTGVAGDSILYLIILLGLVILSFQFAGSALPLRQTDGQDQPVVTLLPQKKEASKPNMQMHYFRGVTGVPTKPPSTIAGGAVVFVPANKTETCGGKWNLRSFPINGNPLGNFGDPQCTYSKEALAQLITKMENGNQEFVTKWMVTILPRETGFNPSGWAKPVGAQARLDAGGAWGNFQMGSSKPPGQPPPAPGKNGQFDRGDVNWEMQVERAIRYNRELLNCNFWYWRGARVAGGKVNRC